MDKKIDEKILRSRRRKLWLRIGGAVAAVGLAAVGLLMMVEKKIDSRVQK
ncbi:MAG: hypothetical protein K2F75_01290 [Paramuribaculum sp.]|nr:hypothetical protein [Paramuribaculum sp.]